MMAIETAASIAESFLYVYLGLSALTINPQFVIIELIEVVVIATVLGRFMSVLIPIGIIYMMKGKKMRLKWNEVVLISIGGIIRGAIAFGLALGITTEHKDVMITTVQIIVLLTTVIFGSTMGLIAKCLNIKSDEMINTDLTHPLIYD